MTNYEGKFANRTDAHHVLAQLPPVGGPEHSAPNFVRAVERWRPNGTGGLVLLGPTGTGKTTAIVHLARVLLAKIEGATSTLFAIASDLADDHELTERAKRVQFLFLDDLGKETDPKNRIFKVLDHRHTRLPTFISTGLKGEDLDEHYDGATVRRIFEFRGKRVTTVSMFAATPKLAKVRPPSDQEELEKRLNGGQL